MQYRIQPTANNNNNSDNNNNIKDIHNNNNDDNNENNLFIPTNVVPGEHPVTNEILGLEEGVNTA